MKISPLWLSFLFAFLYVLIGTICLFCLVPPLYNTWVSVGLVLTLPVTVLSFAVMFAERDATVYVLVIQTIMFLLTWYILYKNLPSKVGRQGRGRRMID